MAQSPETEQTPPAVDFTTELTRLKEAGLTFSQIMQVFGEARDGSAYGAAAYENFHVDGELEFDDTLIVSEGSDPGAYVLCWKWVDRSLTSLPEEEEEED